MDYDVALSFAGEDRTYVDRVADVLRQQGIRVFYDKYETVDLWGKNLFEHLSDVYQNKALCTILFISQHYGQKLWTNHERSSAQARAFRERQEYILPARFDMTQIPGVLDTIGYVDLRQHTPEEFAAMAVEKIGRLKRTKTDTVVQNPPGAVEEFKGPVIVWRLPRGFLVLSNLMKDQRAGVWDINIDYYGYPLIWLHSTVYSELYYEEWFKVEYGLAVQLRKLGIKRGDWDAAIPALHLAADIRHQRIHVDDSPETTDKITHLLRHKNTIFVASGVVAPQTTPPAYQAHVRSGALRDLAAEVNDLGVEVETWPMGGSRNLEALSSEVRRVRRQSRIALYELLPGDHAACRNFEEVVEAHRVDMSQGELARWLGEFYEVLCDAITASQDMN